MNKKIILKRDDKTNEEIIISIYLPKYEVLNQFQILEKSKVGLKDPTVSISLK